MQYITSIIVGVIVALMLLYAAEHDTAIDVVAEGYSPEQVQALKAEGYWADPQDNCECLYPPPRPPETEPDWTKGV